MKEVFCKRNRIGRALTAARRDEFVALLKRCRKPAAFVIPVAAAGVLFVACEVEKVEVETEQIDSLAQIENMLGDKFSVAALVEEQAKQKFGDGLVSLACQNANGTGKVVAIFVEDGILKKATTELDLTAKDFDGKIYAYNTYLKEGNTLSFYQNGQEQEVDLSKPGIVPIPQADGSLAVLDTTKAEEKIENAILSVQQTEFDLQTDLDEVGKEDFKTLLGFVIEKDQTAHLPTLSVEYDRAKDQTTATYSYLSLGQEKKIEGGSIVFDGDVTANGNLDRAAAEEQLQAEKATISKKTPTVLEQSDFTKLYQIENFDTNSVELEVAEKDSGGEVNPPDEPQISISKDQYADLDGFFADLSGQALQEFQTAISETLRNGLSAQDIITIYGVGATKENSRTFKIAFNAENTNEISEIKYAGLVGDVRVTSATLRFVSPISTQDILVTNYSGQMQEIVENGKLVGISYVEDNVAKQVKVGSNQMFVKAGTGYRLIDFSKVVGKFERANISKIVSDFAYTGSESLEGEDLDFFKLCMPLAVAAGKIGQETKLSFVSVQGSSGTTDEFGSTYGVEIKAVDLSSNQLYNLWFIFDDARTSYKPIIEEIKRAISDGQFRISDRGVEKIIPESDILLEYPSDITEYTIPQAEAEETN